MSDATLLPKCGIVRPIAAMMDYTQQHWDDIHNILSEAIQDAGYFPRLVSNSNAIGIILRSIVSNLYDDPIVICDVSGKNANVMFELGMRMAFQKPVIIVKDDQTDFSFDISPIKHISYPKTLRYASINEFKKEITTAIKSTIEASQRKEYRGYLQEFGPIKVTEIGTQEISLSDLAEEIKDVKVYLQNFERQKVSISPISSDEVSTISPRMQVIGFKTKNLSEEQKENLSQEISQLKLVETVRFSDAEEPGSMYVAVTFRTTPYLNNDHFEMRYRERQKVVLDILYKYRQSS